MADRWDRYFLDIAEAVSRKSSCYSIKRGAVLVRDNSIISTGYNGPPRGVPHCENRPESGGAKVCPRRMLGYGSGEGLHLCPAGHAERNALINAARMGVSTKDATLYLYNCGLPCKDCLIEIINAGVVRVVTDSESQYDELTPWLLSGSSIKVEVVK